MSVELQRQLLLAAALGLAADQAHNQALAIRGAITTPGENFMQEEAQLMFDEFARKYVAELDKQVQTT